MVAGIAVVFVHGQDVLVPFERKVSFAQIEIAVSKIILRSNMARVELHGALCDLLRRSETFTAHQALRIVIVRLKVIGILLQVRGHDVVVTAIVETSEAGR